MMTDPNSIFNILKHTIYTFIDIADKDVTMNAEDTITCGLVNNFDVYTKKAAINRNLWQDMYSSSSSSSESDDDSGIIADDSDTESIKGDVGSNKVINSINRQLNTSKNGICSKCKLLREHEPPSRPKRAKLEVLCCKCEVT